MGQETIIANLDSGNGTGYGGAHVMVFFCLVLMQLILVKASLVLSLNLFGYQKNKKIRALNLFIQVRLHLPMDFGGLILNRCDLDHYSLGLVWNGVEILWTWVMVYPQKIINSKM